MAVKSLPLESCNEACARTGDFFCSDQMLTTINTCEYLNEFFEDDGGCKSCKSEYISFGPARRNLNNSNRCFISSEQMLLNCDNAEEDFERVCPCLPNGPEPMIVNVNNDFVN